MSKTKVLVHGALGKMGQTVLLAVQQEPSFELVGAVDINAKDSFLSLPNSQRIPLAPSINELITTVSPDVVVDFSTAKAMVALAQAVLTRKVCLVSGTTGISQSDMALIASISESAKTGAIIASNFAIGALLMIHLGQIAAKYFDYAEIIEEHHQFKLDAPSGTALTTAKAMVKSRGKAFVTPEHKGEPQISRGQNHEGIAIHSIRMQGIVARQKITLGGMGQTLSIMHDAINRECYMPGVMLAIRQVRALSGLTIGLESLLGL